MLQFVVEEQARRQRALSSVRSAGAGGESVPAALQRRFQEVFAVQLREGYALTESCPVTFNRLAEVRIGSIGPAAPGVSIRLVDLHGHDVASGETGEILVRSPANCVGYWNDPDATGRIKQLIIRGGSNISPQEVEEALHQHPAVLEAGVIGMPDPVHGEKVIAFVALREGLTAGEKELRDLVRSRIADYKTPERILFLPVLPKGLTGKVQRRALKDLVVESKEHGLAAKASR